MINEKDVDGLLEWIHYAHISHVTLSGARLSRRIRLGTYQIT